MTKAESCMTIQTPYGVKNWSFVKRVLDTHDELVSFIEACADCEDVDSLHDFFINHFEDVIARAKGE
jgi:hypothetical protein